MDLKKIAKAFLFPHILVMILLLPIAATSLAYCMIALGSDNVLSYASYVISAYTLTVWCVRIPKIISFCKSFKNNNKYAKLWLGDPRLRVNATLTATTLWNCGYAALQLGQGIIHDSIWSYSLAVYYVLLAVMRFFLVRHSAKNRPGEKMREELVRYRFCGIVFLLMNIALTAMMIYMIDQNTSFKHHEITTITMAAYTFFTFTKAIVDIIKYRKYESPIFSAAKAISLTAASVSMLTLESTMLATFSDGSMTDIEKKIFMAISGFAISVCIISMALYMIVQSTKKLKLQNDQNNNNEVRINGQQ